MPAQESGGGAGERQIEAIFGVLVGVLVVAAMCAAVVGAISVMLQPMTRFNAIGRSKAGWVAVVLLVPFGFIFYLVSIRPKLVAVGDVPLVSSRPQVVQPNPRPGPSRQVKRPQAPTSHTIVYDTSRWSKDGQANLVDQLEQRGVRFELEGHDLVVDDRHEQMVDLLVVEFDVTDTVLPRVAYATEYWSPAKFANIRDRLTTLGIAHSFDNGELIVAKDHEEAVNGVLATPDYSPADESPAE